MMVHLEISRALASILTFVVLNVLITVTSLASDRFRSSYSCQDVNKKCASSGVKTVDGYQVHRDCWEWSYDKSCNYPSKNDCSRYSHCYEVAIRDCLLKDSIGNCVNQLKEFSCKRWVSSIRESQKVRTALEEKDGQEGLVCEGVPCIDGNCVDKSYLTNGEMMDSVSKLYAVSEGKVDGNMNFEIFKGDSWHCSKKMAQYTNCCSTGNIGWGKNLGAGCTKDEQQLLENRNKKLCTYVGKQEKQTIGVTTLVKHYWCCFDSLLSRVIQEEGRKQLGMTFGSGGSPDCRGFTIEELERIDFHKIDLSEFIEDFKVKFFGKYKAPNIADMEARVRGTLPDIRKYDGNPNNRTNNTTGWSAGVKDDSWEAEEEKQFEEERSRRVREEEAKVAAENARKAEERRQAEIKRQEEEARQARIRAEEERKRRKANLERELSNALSRIDEIRAASRKLPRNGFMVIEAYGAEEIRLNNLYHEACKDVKRIRADLANGNY